MIKIPLLKKKIVFGEVPYFSYGQNRISAVVPHLSGEGC